MVGVIYGCNKFPTTKWVEPMALMRLWYYLMRWVGKTPPNI